MPQLPNGRGSAEKIKLLEACRFHASLRSRVSSNCWAPVGRFTFSQTYTKLAPSSSNSGEIGLVWATPPPILSRIAQKMSPL